MRTVAIIQARMGSERLPGKALMNIGDKTILEWVIFRTLLVEGVDEVMVATTIQGFDDPIYTECLGLGIECCRGARFDVLDRYYEAAEGYDGVLRVTADCPLLDPGINSRIVDTLKTTDAEYVSMSTRSNGLVQEAFSIGALQRAWENATDPYDREHVVPWMIRNEKTRFLKPDFDLGSGRWCVDTQEDLDRLRALYAEDPCLFELTAEELVGREFAVS